MLPHGTLCLRNSVASMWRKIYAAHKFFHVLRDPPKHVKNLKKQGFSLPFWPKWRSRARPRAVAKNHDFWPLFGASTCMIKKIFIIHSVRYTSLYCVTLLLPHRSYFRAPKSSKSGLVRGPSKQASRTGSPLCLKNRDAMHSFMNCNHKWYAYKHITLCVI